jgi:hypothetical protein
MLKKTHSSQNHGLVVMRRLDWLKGPVFFLGGNLQEFEVEVVVEELVDSQWAGHTMKCELQIRVRRVLVVVVVEVVGEIEEMCLLWLNWRLQWSERLETRMAWNQNLMSYCA